jgi:hypothetical protein
MTKKEEQAVLIFERKIFRRIYDPKYEKGEWKSRTNRELEEMSKGEHIVKWIKGQRISWLGHLERMGEDRMTKKIFTQELETTRRKERPRKRCREEEKDLQMLGVRRWRELVTDRTKWRDKPKPTMDCSANGRSRRMELTGNFTNKTINLSLHNIKELFHVHIRALVALYHMNTDKCTRTVQNHHSINTVRNSNMFQLLIVIFRKHN